MKLTLWIYSSLILLQVFDTTSSKNIHVSHNRFSNDTVDCGSILQPCASINHAIRISVEFDTILLDAEYKYVFQERFLFILKSVNITSYQSVNITSYQSSGHERDAHLVFLDHGFVIQGNLSLSKVNIQHNLPLLFFIQKDMGYLDVENCYIEYQDFDQLFGIFHNSWNFTFTNTKFILHKDNSTINSDLESTSYRYINSHNVQNAVIKYQDCHFRATDWIIVQFIATITIFNRCQFSKIIANNKNNKVIRISRCSFSSSAFLSSKIEKHSANISILQTTFLSSVPISFSRRRYAQVELMHVATVLIDNCLFQEALTSSLKAQHNKDHVIIRNTIFRSNTVIRKQTGIQVKLAGALTIKGSKIVLSNCSFHNNTAAFVDTIYAELEHPGIGFTMLNSIVKSGKPLSTRETIIINLIPPKNFHNDILYIENSTITCPSNHHKTYRRTEDKYFKLVCIKCDSTSYNSGAFAKVEWGTRNSTSAENFNEQNTTCYPCPYQASCINTIRSKGNYWGHSNSTGAVSFILCPPSYCCSSLLTCTSYNTCANNRKGTLCGDCIDGHSFSLLNPSRCVPSDHCSVHIFWVGFVLAVLLTCFSFMYKKELITLAKTAFTKISCKIPTKNVNLIPTATPESVPYSLVNESSTDIDIVRQDPRQGIISGIIKITFFFYQTASIIRINASAKVAYKMPYIIGILTSFFNIKIDIHTTTNVDICPIQSNKIMVIEALRSSVVITCLLLLLFMVFSIWIVNKILERFRKRKEDDKEEADKLTEPGMTISTRLKGTYLQLLLLGYSSIATLCLQAVTCIDINGSSYLYAQASVKCYQLWQKFIFGFIGICLVPFPIAIYIGCQLVRWHKVTSNHFLLMITFPPASVWFLVTNKKRNIESTTFEAEHFLSILNEPFRYVDDNNGFQLIWEPILIVRRLVLATTVMLIISPLEKLYPAFVLLLTYTFHGMIVLPYANHGLNILDFVSMLLLCLLAVVNLFWAFSNDIDITQNPLYDNLGKAFLFLEVTILLLPFIFCLGFIFYKLGKSIHKVLSRKQD